MEDRVVHKKTCLASKNQVQRSFWKQGRRLFPTTTMVIIFFREEKKRRGETYIGEFIIQVCATSDLFIEIFFVGLLKWFSVAVFSVDE